MQKKYTDLIFDLYGTLVDIHTEETPEVWEKTAIYFGFYGAHYTGVQLETAFQKNLAAREAKAGQSYECFPDIPFEEVFSQLFEAKDIPDSEYALGKNAAQLFRILSFDYIRLYPHVTEALDSFRQKGLRLWLLSNAQHIFTAYELEHLGLANRFDGVLLSSDYRCRKPDTRFFHALLDGYGLDPKNCLMIGNDRETDIAGAVNAGLDTLYLHTGMTPADQAPAAPALHPAVAPENCRHFELEGADWEILAKLLTN